MLSPAEAEKLILENTAPRHREDCALGAAGGRVLRSEIRADRDLPPFHRVTMDGYALRTAAVQAGRRVFRVEGVQAAGMRAFKLGPAADACLEVMTGAVAPEGADAIIPYEQTKRDGANITLLGDDLHVEPGACIHARGSDHRVGEVIVPAGVRLTGREIAVAAACGYGTLSVSQLPKIAVVATGDELVEVDHPVAPHQIRRSNDYALRAALAAAGYPHVARFHLRDVRHEIEHLLWHIIAEYDVVVISGGVSKGKFDFLPGELDRQGVRRVFQGVAQKPGKPFWFGVSARQTPVFALPGNPVSAYTCLHRFVLPALAHASGLAPAPLARVVLADKVVFPAPLAYLLPVKLATGRGAEALATPMPSNTSGDFSGLLGTDGFVELAAEPKEFAAGTLVPFRPWL